MEIKQFSNPDDIDQRILGPEGLNTFETEVWPVYEKHGYDKGTALLAWQNEVIISGLTALLLATTQEPENEW